MKRNFLTIMTLFAALSLSAANTNTASVNITITGATSGSDVCRLAEDASKFTAGFDNGYDSYQPEANIPGIYAVCGTDYFTDCASNNLEEQALGVVAGADTEYTLTFANLKGNYKLYDAVKDSLHTMSAAYTFTMAANARVNDRFFIRTNAPVFTPSVCHQYGKLLVTGYKAKTVTITNAEGVEKLNKVMATNNEEIDLATLTAGQYTVVVDTKTYIIKVL